jgi:integrase
MKRRRWLVIERGEPRAVLAEDRTKILRELNLRCRPSERGEVSFCALRLRAAVLLAADSALRIGEMLKLDAVQVIDDPSVPRWKLRSVGYVRPEQSKGRRVGEDQWDSSGSFLLGDEPRAALRVYLSEAKRRGYLPWPPKPGDPLFLSVRGNANTEGPEARRRLSVRTLQWQWGDFQAHAALPSPYHWHCLRHTAMTACAAATNGNVAVVAAFGRCDVQTAMGYCRAYITPARMLELRNLITMR